MTYLGNYSREQLIASARERGIYAPENANDEELKLVDRRLSAERGWLVEPPPPPTEWHTPGWIKDGGRHFITPPDARVPASSTVRLEGGQLSEPPERSPNGPVRC